MIELNIKKYSTIIFDCDGVILNSNKIKTKVFFEATKKFGIKNANQMVDYHIKNGGISRYKKFEYFIINILRKPFDQILFNKLLKFYSSVVVRELIKCEVASGLKELHKHTKKSKWLVVSGSDQEELREVFLKKKINNYFSGGIYGSPESKDQIINREKKKCILEPAIYLGDSEYDFKIANQYGFDFLFLSDWTELLNWREWIKKNKIYELPSIKNILDT